MYSEPVRLYIDGSAKENYIGAGLIVLKPHQASPHTLSYHMIMNQPATSTIAEFFALRKALEWIQEHQPNSDVYIITDSREVVSKIPQRIIPRDLHHLLSQLQNTFPHQIHFIQAKSKKHPFIEKAHNASREYIKSMPNELLGSIKSYIPTLSSYSWICVQLQEEFWIASKRDSEIKTVHSNPIRALYDTVIVVLQRDKNTHLYFDVNATQIINHHVHHAPSPEAKFLFEYLQKKAAKIISKVKN